MVLMNKTAKILTAVCLVCAFFCVPFAAQEESDDEIVRVISNLVVVNVTVTDASGKYVKGLKRQDFRVYEDGKEQPLETFSSFGDESTPFAAAILLDTSGSMETRMSLARAAAIRFLDNLRDEDVSAVYRFDVKTELMQEFSFSRDLHPMVFEVKAKGMTALNDAIVQASNDLAQRPERRRAVIILSDGADNHSEASTDKAIEKALANNSFIYAVNMNDPRDGNGADAILRQNVGALKKMAEKTGGRYVATPGGKELREAFTQIAEELRSQYTIGYRPTDPTRDGRWRNLEVKLAARPELTARARKGYRVPKEK
jgi:Ca-activated chloride channel family protein